MKIFSKLFYYSINDLFDALKAFLNVRYIKKKQRFFGKYILRNRSNIKIGKNFKAYHNFFAEAHEKGEIIIGDGCVFNRNAYLTCFQKIIIGDNSLFGPNLFIGDHDHGIYEGKLQSNPREKPVFREILPQSIEIGENVWVGNNVTIMKGSKIGYGSIIGANSIVKGTIPPLTIAAGSPAKIKKKFSEKTFKWEKI